MQRGLPHLPKANTSSQPSPFTSPTMAPRSTVAGVAGHVSPRATPTDANARDALPAHVLDSRVRLALAPNCRGGTRACARTGQGLREFG
jgi:hypothetical protein